MPRQRVLCHTDHQPLVLQTLQRAGGRSVRVTAFTEEHVFLVEVVEGSLDLAALLAQHSVVTYRDYIARCSSKCEHLAE
jgi:hypothetical protein